jgi:hypothetical protein
MFITAGHDHTSNAGAAIQALNPCEKASLSLLLVAQLDWRPARLVAAIFQ